MAHCTGNRDAFGDEPDRAIALVSLLVLLTLALAFALDTRMSEDLYWLAGLLDGEGTFLHGPPSSPSVPVVRVEMTDLDVVEHVAGMFRRTVQRNKQRAAGHKPSFSTTVKGAAAAH